MPVSRPIASQALRTRTTRRKPPENRIFRQAVSADAPVSTCAVPRPPPSRELIPKYHGRLPIIWHRFSEGGHQGPSLGSELGSTAAVVLAEGEGSPAPPRADENRDGCTELCADLMMVDRVPVSVVDDDESVRESLPDLLEELGYDVQAFSSAADFLASDRLPQTKCLILDIAMPGMSGPDLQRELIRRRHHIPVIFITARQDMATRRQVI